MDNTLKPYQNNVPQYQKLQNQLTESSMLLDDIVLKNYLSKLSSFEIIPLQEDMRQISDIRLFKITEMVYQKDEYSTYKFASVFNALQNLNCGIFLIMDSNGQKTDFYMGVRSFDGKHTTKSLKDTLENALHGQFPGIKTETLFDEEAEAFLESMPSGNVSTVSCVAKNKDEDFNNDKNFLQGLEKLAFALQDKKYTAIILAKSTPADQLAEVRNAYETIYTQLSPFANMQISYGTSQALNVSEAFSQSSSTGTSHSSNVSEQSGYSNSKTTSENNSVTKVDGKAAVAKSLGLTLLGVAGLVTAPLTGGISLLAAAGIGAGYVGLSAYQPKSTTTGHSEDITEGKNYSKTEGHSDTYSQTTSEGYTRSKGTTTTSSDNMQLTRQNKTLIDILDRIDRQLKRLDECESTGMWECAAYFLSDTSETAEMAAGTYKALMKGEQSGVEASAINCWGYQEKTKVAQIRDYVTHFVHPVFAYRSRYTVPVTPASLVSGNELAIHMGLPRRSVCGFPVIEHAEFGREVIKYQNSEQKHRFKIGNVFNMGTRTDTEVRIDRDSLTMHTFVTGSTGSGKSNTVYEILNKLRLLYHTPFLVVEPAKGEYKNVFGQFPDVTVYGTNPKKFAHILRINPFRFPSDIHVLEHLDRLVEIFNVCWPMYAAMPAILKDAMERAYVAAGWDLALSENPKGDIYPNFADVLEQIEDVIETSKYSADSKGDYSGALCTRVRSLTTGLNRLIFTENDLEDTELFDQNVIVDISRVGSMETKSLIMGILVMKLNEYRMVSGEMNSGLKHITVLEEAHNLLKRTSTEQSSESSNLLGKSVELLANSIAEMRTYGEGFIVADQSPGLLDMSAIRNTNTKIILRLPDQSDRELVGYAAGLDKEQIQELARLERGVAAVYQNDWVEPVLVQIEKCNIEEKLYEECITVNAVDLENVKGQILNFLLQGRVYEKLDFDVDEIHRSLSELQLSTRRREFLQSQIEQYNAKGYLSFWDDKNFDDLSREVVELLGIRSRAEKMVVTAQSNGDLTERLDKLTQEIVPELLPSVRRELNHCIMKDLSLGEDEADMRRNIYRSWVEYERGRRM